MVFLLVELFRFAGVVSVHPPNIPHYWGVPTVGLVGMQPVDLCLADDRSHDGLMWGFGEDLFDRSINRTSFGPTAGHVS